MDSTSPTNTPPASSSEPAASIQVLTLPVGTYAFTVKEGASETSSEGALTLPAIQVGLAPVRSAGTIEFLSGASAVDRWLARPSDVIIAKISGGDVALLLTSVRTETDPVLGIDIRRVEAPVEHAALPANQGNFDVLSMRTIAHIRNVGDVYFNDGWIGCLGDQLWIEGFGIVTAGELAPDALEYSGVNVEGFQTQWLSGQDLCGSRGLGQPMMGFAVRLKPDFAGIYECQYSGKFVSGTTIGPMRNGELCCSHVPGDPLWGIQLQIAVRKASAEKKNVEEVQASSALAQVG